MCVNAWRKQAKQPSLDLPGSASCLTFRSHAMRVNASRKRTSYNHFVRRRNAYNPMHTARVPMTASG